MNKIMRCITTDGSIMAAAIDSSDIVHIAQSIHRTSPVATAALGTFVDCISIMGTMLKQKNTTVTLSKWWRLVERGSDFRQQRNCRGNVTNPEVNLPLKDNGKLDVGGAVGKDGLLLVIRDYGEGEPYMVKLNWYQEKLRREHYKEYFATSEQIPTVCTLGVYCWMG
ncbi:MAG: Hsp33 family molecular chaperone HslO [Eubacteriales bacterium]